MTTIFDKIIEKNTDKNHEITGRQRMMKYFMDHPSKKDLSAFEMDSLFDDAGRPDTHAYDPTVDRCTHCGHGNARVNAVSNTRAMFDYFFTDALVCEGCHSNIMKKEFLCGPCQIKQWDALKEALGMGVAFIMAQELMENGLPVNRDTFLIVDRLKGDGDGSIYKFIPDDFIGYSPEKGIIKKVN